MSFYGLIAPFFLVLNNIPLSGYICHSLFIHSPIKECLDWLKVLAIISEAAISICVQGLCGHMFQLLWLGSRNMIAGLHGKNMFSFVKKTPDCFLK